MATIGRFHREGMVVVDQGMYRIEEELEKEKQMRWKKDLHAA